MFARHYQFTINPTRMNEVEQLADSANEILKAQKGFRSVTFYADRETGACGSFSLWETREDLDAYANAEFPQLKKPAAGLFTGPSQSAVFEVYEPKA